MGVHEQFTEDLALYALDALTGEDRAKIEKHLAGCPACRLELEQLRGDGAMLALSTLGPKPPQRARQRLLDAVAKQPRIPAKVEDAARIAHPFARSAKGSERRSWWGVLGWAAAAAVIVFAAALWKENAALKQTLVSASAQATQSARELEDIRRIAAPIIEPDAQVVTVVALRTQPQPQGKAFYLRNRGSLVFLATNMPPLPPSKAYELWLIPTQGAPIAAGVFKPDAHGRGSIINPPLPPGALAKTFAITVENEAGSPVPTTPVVMVGAGE
jgi:anti-sigma-K factor RskA